MDNIFATLKTRLYARSLDLLCVIVLAVIISSLSLYYRHSDFFPYKSSFPFYLFLLFFCWIWVSTIDSLYNVFFLPISKHGTYGMHKSGIRIVNKNGEKISILRAFIRYALYGTPIEVLMKMIQELRFNDLDFSDSMLTLSVLIMICSSPLLMYFHPQKQAYYDIICGTYVIYND